jgi:uncharacterized protein (DUF3084 family)
MADGGFILILVVLFLGGLIATLGDRIGTKVGKARLSLFNLRPRKTAVLVTVFTGVLISASTLGVLLLASSGFRDMLLRFDVIRSSLNQTRKDLDRAKAEIKSRSDEKDSIEAELIKSRAKSRQVQNTLDKINDSLKTALARQRDTEARRLAVERQAVILRSEIVSLNQEQQVLASQRDEVRAQIAQRDQELAARTGEVAARDREIQSRKVIIAEREKSLKFLEQEQSRLIQKSIEFTNVIEALKKEQTSLANENTEIRQKLPAIPTNRILSSVLVQEDIRDPQKNADIAVRLLQNANSFAFRELYPSIPIDRQIINVSSNDPELAGLVRQMSTMSAPYVVQIRSIANYYSDEYYSVETKLLGVRAVLARRLQLFTAGEVLATVKIDPKQLSVSQIQDRIQQLVPLSVIRLNRGNETNGGKWLADVGNEGVDVGQIPPLRNLAEQIKERSDVIEVRALSIQDVYSETGRIPLALVFLQRDSPILDTRTLNMPSIQLQPAQP